MSEMVEAIKQALREIEQEKIHNKVHGMIGVKLSEQTPRDKWGYCKCGICEQIFSQPPLPLTAPKDIK